LNKVLILVFNTLVNILLILHYWKFAKDIIGFISVFEIILLKFRIMKKRILIIGSMIMMMAGMISAQVCPSPYNNTRNYRASSFGYGGSSFYGNSAINNLTYSFSSTIDRGYKAGKLTKSEIRSLEADFRSVEREYRWAYADGRISFHERSTLESYVRRLERSIAREWNDGDIRFG